MVADGVVGRRRDGVGPPLGLAVRADERGLAGLEDERAAAEVQADEARQRRGCDHRADGQREDVRHGGWPGAAATAH